MGGKYFNQKFIEVRVNKISPNLPNHLNPRAALDAKLIKKLEKSLLSAVTDFSALNNGIVVITNDNHACLETGKNVVSIVNGGHTYKAICNVRDKLGEVKSDPYVWVRCIQAEDKEHIAKISECLNSSSRMPPRLLRNSEGKFDPIKKALPKEIMDRLTWRTTQKVKGRESPQLLLDTIAILVDKKTSRVAAHTQGSGHTTYEWISTMAEKLTNKNIIEIISVMEKIAEDLGSILTKYGVKTREAVSLISGANIVVAGDRSIAVAMYLIRDYFDDTTCSFKITATALLSSPEYIEFREKLNTALETNSRAGIKIAPAFIVRNILKLLKQREK